jgi:hypothetical protein
MGRHGVVASARTRLGSASVHMRRKAHRGGLRQRLACRRHMRKFVHMLVVMRCAGQGGTIWPRGVCGHASAWYLRVCEGGLGGYLDDGLPGHRARGQ